MTILVYRTGRLGDFLVSLPAMNAIRTAFADARIVLLTCASTKPAFAAKTWNYADPAGPLPWIEFAQPQVVDATIGFRSLRDWRGLWRVRSRVCRERIQRAYILPFTWETRSAISRKRLFLRAMGVRGPIFGGGRLISPDRVVHQADVALAAAGEDPRVAAVAPGRERIELRIPDANRAWSREALRRAGFDDRQVVVIFAGGTYDHKRWPVASFAELCGHLAGVGQRAFLFVGAASERSWADAVARELTVPFWNACGETPLPRLAALLEQADLFVGNDSGPGHLAAAVGTPCVTFMAELYPAGIWEPRGSRVLTLRHAVPCANCRHETFCPEGTQACIRGISVAEAIAACETLLGASPPISLTTHPPK